MGCSAKGRKNETTYCNGDEQFFIQLVSYEFFASLSISQLADYSVFSVSTSVSQAVRHLVTNLVIPSVCQSEIAQVNQYDYGI